VLLAAMGIVTGAGVSILWLVGGGAVLGGRITVGALVAFYNYVLLFNNPLQWFGQFSDWMTRAFTGADRIFEVLDTTPEAYGDSTSAPTACSPGRIEFRRVTFGYDQTTTVVPVLDDLSLSVMPGEMVGIVGKSGVGKTTMIKLLCRFYDVDAGSIEVDGVDIRQLRLEDLRGSIGIVSQEPILFSGTIAENISYGRPGASLSDIVEAAKLANAHRFILAKPDGYDAQVGERGKHLSVGERQRIAIARAVLRDARILILDEATSSVDALSEVLIHEGLHRLARGRTCIIIAHRLSTLRTADRLVVVDRGRVRESGTYEELMACGGAFRDLVRMQEEPLERAV
jgi:ATP-binding cassette subfamily B protein